MPGRLCRTGHRLFEQTEESDIMTDKGLLLVLVDPAPTLEEEMNDWYDTEHLPERAAIDGFETARRYTSLGDGPRYLAIYDMTSLDLPESEAYLAVSGKNFSPWTKRVTSRTYPVRLTATQVGTNQTATRPCTRLMLLKIRKSLDADLTTVAAGVQESFAAAPGFLQARVFAGVEPRPDFIIAIAEFSGNQVPPLKLQAFGECGEHVALAATYRTYRS
jgi:hypothetical protein